MLSINNLEENLAYSLLSNEKIKRNLRKEVRIETIVRESGHIIFMSQRKNRIDDAISHWVG